MRDNVAGVLVGDVKTEDVLAEIDGRIKRLSAQVEIAEERLRYLEEIGAPSKYRLLQGRKDYGVYYLILLGLWLMAGVLVLIRMKRNLPETFNLPLLPYLIIAAVVAVAPLVYLFLSKKRHPGTPMEELEELERAAKLVISGFYTPLRRAVEAGDVDGMRALAEKLLNDPLLARALERTHEGSPKVMAYALYLYSTYDEDLKGDVEEALTSLTNKPLRMLLRTLLPPDETDGKRE